jgi:chaperone required for assembly of F1-ATPase
MANPSESDAGSRSEPEYLNKPDRQVPAGKRFYEKADYEPRDGVFCLVLDGKPTFTPAKNPLEIPSAALAKAIAKEWEQQAEQIDPSAMLLTKLANSALDHVKDRRQQVIDDIVNFAGSDLICYMAEDPQELMMKQMAAWGPALDWLRQGLAADFEVTHGINHVAQSEQSLGQVRLALKDLDAFSLTSIHTMTTLMGSALLTLAHIAGMYDVASIWQSAHIDEDWQMSKWGKDGEALARREQRWREMEAASRFLDLLRFETK